MNITAPAIEALDSTIDIWMCITMHPSVTDVRVPTTCMYLYRSYQILIAQHIEQ